MPATTVRARRATMETPTDDRRRMPRFDLQLPIEVSHGESGSVLAVTRNVSAGGVYFYVDSGVIQSPTVEFVLTFPPEITLVKSLKVRCTGRVLRVDDSQPPNAGVAAEIQRYEFLTTASATEDA